MNPPNRRDFLWTGAALFIAGCQAPGGSGSLPDVAWPDVGGRPTPDDGAYVPEAAPSTTASGSGAHGSGTAKSPFKRAAWTPTQPRKTNINRMGGIRHITLHHEGFPEAFTSTGRSQCASRIELIRNSHTNRGWADIGYHYIIDPGGRVWEGRPISYQGAHVSNHNENNIGVMMLGNFNLQRPSDRQLSTLRETVRILRRRHGVSEGAIKTHRELGPTSCPGNHLHPRIASMRSNHDFA